MIKFIGIVFLTFFSFLSISHADTLIVKESIGHNTGHYAINLNNGKCGFALENLSVLRRKITGFHLSRLRGIGFSCMNKNGLILDYGRIYQIPFVDDKICLEWSKLSGWNLQDRCNERALKFRSVKLKEPLGDYVKSLIDK